MHIQEGIQASPEWKQSSKEIYRQASKDTHSRENMCLKSQPSETFVVVVKESHWTWSACAEVRIDLSFLQRTIPYSPLSLRPKKKKTGYRDYLPLQIEQLRHNLMPALWRLEGHECSCHVGTCKLCQFWLKLSIFLGAGSLSWVKLRDGNTLLLIYLLLPPFYQITNNIFNITGYIFASKNSTVG